MATSEKIYLLMHVTYGDFDVKIETPVLASSRKEALEEEAARRNDRRTDKQINDCEKYIITDKPIKLI